MNFFTINTLGSRQQELLKLLAICLMTIDHIGAYLFDCYKETCITTLLGRTVFPIFAYLLVYNYIYHTRNKEKYIIKLLTFGAISILPYYLVFGEVFGEFGFNVLITLGAGLGYIYIDNKIATTTPHKALRYSMSGLLLFMLILVSTMYFDFSFIGLLVIFSFYLYLANPSTLNGISLLVTIFLLNLEWNILYGASSVAALLIIHYFNITALGIKRVISGIWFYIYYPAHLLVLYFVARSLS